MQASNLGDRIKRYERASQHVLQPRTPLFIRIDGRAFHTFTRDMDKPFDQRLIDSMVYAMEKTSEDMSGFLMAYHQSDEVTFMLSDFESFESQGWFGYELNKVVSMSASLFTAHFNWHFNMNRGVQFQRLATFDSRAFSVPIEDAPNVFVWRQRDWERNSLSMLARSHFSHKELHGKNRADMHEMLHGVGVNWAELSDQLKNGTFYLRDGRKLHKSATYADISAIFTPAKEAPVVQDAV